MISWGVAIEDALLLDEVRIAVEERRTKAMHKNLSLFFMSCSLAVHKPVSGHGILSATCN